MQKPIAEVFTWPSDEPQLIGSRCDECGAVTFPVQSRCPRCSTTTMSDLLLPTTGTLVSWTTQGSRRRSTTWTTRPGRRSCPSASGSCSSATSCRSSPASPRTTPTKLDFGMAVELQIVPFYTDADGDEIVTFAFAPTSN